MKILRFCSLPASTKANRRPAPPHPTPLQASSPVEATALAMLTAWLLSYSTGCTRVVQLLTLSQLKLVVPALLSYSSTPSSPSVTPSQPLGQAPPPAPAAPATATSPRKELTAHRLSERKGRSPRHKHRWSFDVAPVSGPRREPRQRASSADLRAPGGAASPNGSASPRRYPSPQRAGGALAAAAAAATLTEAPLRRGGRQWQPSMQRIASGQQLAEQLPAPASRRASMDKKRRQPPTLAAHPPCNILSEEPGPVAAPATPITPCTSPQPVAAAQPVPAAQPAAVSPAMATAPSMPATPSAASSPPFASLSSWASWTVDSVLRPLLPGASKPAEDSSQGLVRTQSAPTQLPSEPKAPASPRESLGEGMREGVRALFGGVMRRRTSIDESTRSYTTGGIEADPSRWGRLRRLGWWQQVAAVAGHAAACGGGRQGGKVLTLA